MTNQGLIDQALIEVGIIDEGSSGTSTQSNDALAKLNQMMAEWAVSDMDLHQFPQDTLGDTSPLPSWAIGGVINSLAVILAPSYSVPVSTLLYEKEKSGKNLIGVTLINAKLENTDMSHLPTGGYRQGNILNDR